MSASPHAAYYHRLLPLLAVAPVRAFRPTVRKPRVDRGVAARFAVATGHVLRHDAGARHDGQYYARWRERRPA